MPVSERCNEIWVAGQCAKDCCLCLTWNDLQAIVTRSFSHRTTRSGLYCTAPSGIGRWGLEVGYEALFDAGDLISCFCPAARFGVLKVESVHRKLLGHMKKYGDD